MRVLIIGGLCRSLINFRAQMLMDMVSLGHKVTTCAGEPEAEVVTKLASMGISFREVELRRRGTSVFGDLRTYHSLRRIISAVRPDVVLSYTVKPVVYGSLAAAHLDVPVIAAMITGAGATQPGTTLREKLLTGITRRLYACALKNVQVVFFQNPDDELLFRECGLVRTSRVVQIAGSGVDLSHFTPAAPVTRPVTFLLIARLLVNKGIREYLSAAARLREQYGLRVRFLLVGGSEFGAGGLSTDELDSWIERGVVEYCGHLDDVRPAIRESSVYVLPSYREGTPRTSLEAMAMGRPVVTTDVPGCRETVIDGRNGFLVEVRNPQALGKAMERFISSPKLIESMGKESVEFVRKRFDVRLVNQTILAELGLS